MNVRIDVTDQQRFVPLVQQGKVAAWATLMVTAYPDQYSMLSNFHSKSPFNYWGYNSPEVDGLLAQALGTQDEKARIAIYNQVEAKLMDDAAIMPIMWGKFYFLQKPYVSGFRTNPLGIMAYTNLEIK
jgi:ABC-type transport system substrate-binding protein